VSTLSEPVLKKPMDDLNREVRIVTTRDVNEEAPEWLPEEGYHDNEPHRFRAKSDTTEKESIAIRHSHEILN